MSADAAHVRNALMDLIEPFTLETMERTATYEELDDRASAYGTRLLTELQARGALMRDMLATYERLRALDEALLVLGIEFAVTEFAAGRK